MNFFNQNRSSTQVIECYNLVAFYGLRAMRFKKIPNEAMYQHEISLLAKTCMLLVTEHKEEPQQVVTQMEAFIIAAYRQEISQLNEEIQSLFDKRKHLSPSSSQGENEITKITLQIAELEKRKLMSNEQQISSIVYDTVQEASRNNGIKFSDEIYLNLAKHQNELHLIKSTLNEEASIPTSYLPIGNN